MLRERWCERSSSCAREKAQRIGALMCATMREKLSRQMFEVVIQAAANGKIIARETLKVRLSIHFLCRPIKRAELSTHL